MQVDTLALNRAFRAFMKRLKEHFDDDFHVTNHQLDDFFMSELEPWRKMEADVPGLKAKLDAFEAVSAVSSISCSDDQAKLRFVQAVQEAVATDEDNRHHALNHLVSMFTVLRGSWFIPMFANGLPTVPNTPVYGLRDDTVAAAK